MKPDKKKRAMAARQAPPVSARERAGSHGRIVAAPEDNQYLSTEQLACLEQAFRAWVEATPRVDVRLSRRRVLLIFLLIRHTGAKLNEVLALDPGRDIDLDHQRILFGNRDTGNQRERREVHLAAAFAGELRLMLADPLFKRYLIVHLGMDPGFLRLKFYERAAACGFPKRLGAPEMVRKSRGAELLRNNLPLPAVQMLLGHSTPTRTGSYVTFSDEEIRQVTRHFLERESARSTSARNVFWGKIRTIRRGDIQSLVVLATISGHEVTTMITNDSLERLALQEGKLVAAEVKAPWLTLQKGGDEPPSSADNRLHGVITRIRSGEVAAEYVVRIADQTELCAVVASEAGRRLGLKEHDPVWVLFNSFAAVLHLD